MAGQTTNFKFTKPDANEFYDVNVQNENWEIVDKQMIPSIAVYYNNNESVDAVIKPFVLINVNSSVNSELHNIVGGTHAWVWTNFSITPTVKSHRIQIAMSYNTIYPKMAYRTYGANGWLEWKEIATVDKVPTLDTNGKVLKEQLPDNYTYGTNDLTPGESILETGKLYFVYG